MAQPPPAAWHDLGPRAAPSAAPPAPAAAPAELANSWKHIRCAGGPQALLPDHGGRCHARWHRAWRRRQRRAAAAFQRRVALSPPACPCSNVPLQERGVHRQPAGGPVRPAEPQHARDAVLVHARGCGNRGRARCRQRGQPGRNDWNLMPWTAPAAAAATAALLRMPRAGTSLLRRSLRLPLAHALAPPPPLCSQAGPPWCARCRRCWLRCRAWCWSATTRARWGGRAVIDQMLKQCWRGVAGWAASLAAAAASSSRRRDGSGHRAKPAPRPTPALPRQTVAFCGVFPEIKRAWAYVDNSLFLWRFDKWCGQGGRPCLGGRQ